MANFFVSVFLTFFGYRHRAKGTGYRTLTFYTKFILMGCLPLLNILLTYLQSPAGCPRGYTGPGGKNLKESLADCTGGANLAIDRWVFGNQRIPTDPTCKYIYGCDRFDSYGLLGTLNFIFTVFLGSKMGEYFMQFRKQTWNRAQHGAVQMVKYLLAGMALMSIPGSSPFVVNKNIWSISFVFIANGLTIFIFIIFFILTQYKVILGWPFRAVGKNALMIVFLTPFFQQRFPFGFKHNGSHLSTTIHSLLSTTTYVSLALFLHQYRFYIKY